MASQILSGSGNVSYTNNTGQNVRVIINFMRTSATTDFANATIAISWGGVGVTAPLRAIGRNVAFSGPGSSGNNAVPGPTDTNAVPGALPTELMLAPNQTFTAVCGAYNIVVIPEAG